MRRRTTGGQAGSAKARDGARPRSAKARDGARPHSSKARDGARPRSAKTRDGARPRSAKTRDGAKADAERTSAAAPRGKARTVEIVVDGVQAPVRSTGLARFCARALRAAGFSSWDVAVLLCGDRRIQDLNGRYRGKPVPTDVLSFPRGEVREGEAVRGDIAVSLETLGKNAARFGTSENEEMKRLLVHGLLHLAGMDHGRGKSGRMLALQEGLLLGLQSDRIYGERRK